MDLQSTIEGIQRALGVTVDGKAGPETWAAIYNRVCAPGGSRPVVVSCPDAIDLVDERSERAIATLHKKVRPSARALVKIADAQGITIIVTSGTRTYSEQDDLFAQGRSKGGAIVTNARGGYSNHNFGIAFDVTIFNGTTPVYESPLYKAIGSLGKSLGLTWGGDWTSIDDEPHFELRPDWAVSMSETAMLAELRDRKAAGKDAFV